MKPAGARFLLSAARASEFPPERNPEVAFAGRSNVGKSSLINGLLGVKNLAKTSSTPGKTRLINFFEIDDAMCWVDLPGYGYAAVSKRTAAGWRDLVEHYLLNRKSLVMVLVLVDPRHGPNESDGQLLAWLRCHEKPSAVVLTKADKVSKVRLNEVRERCSEEHRVPGDRLFAYTIRRPRNVELWNFIKAAARRQDTALGLKNRGRA